METYWSYEDCIIEWMDKHHLSIIQFVIVHDVWDWCFYSDVIKSVWRVSFYSSIKYLTSNHILFTFNKWYTYDGRVSYKKILQLDKKYIEYLKNKYFNISIKWIMDKEKKEEVVIKVEWDYPCSIQMWNIKYDYVPWLWLTKAWCVLNTRSEFLRWLREKKSQLWEIRARWLKDNDLVDAVKDTIHEAKKEQSRRDFYQSLPAYNSNMSSNNNKVLSNVSDIIKDI